MAPDLRVVRDKAIAITGGTGTFGHAFVEQLLRSNVRRIVVLSRDEWKQHQMRRQFPDARMRFLPGDVRDLERLRLAFQGIDIVIHAAAMKQVPACEEHPREAFATNCQGSWNVILASIDCGVERAVLLSTDKSCNPNTTYGSTKLTAERSFVASNVYAAGRPTRFLATRYGNVLGSRGSVVEVFRAQAAQENPVLTITDKRCTRFWMTTTDAVDLVLLALQYGRGGEVFVPACGAAPLTKLAHVIAPDAAIEEVGIRPYEKIHESLIGEDEARYTWATDFGFVIEPVERTWESQTVVPRFNRQPVGDDFTYRSDNALMLSSKELRAMLHATGL